MKRIIAFFMCAVLFLPMLSCAEKPKTEEFFAMDTFVQITLLGGSESDFDAVRSVIELTENNYSATRAGSLVYNLNKEKSVEKETGLEQMLVFGKKMTEITDGAYDLTVRPLMKLYGFGDGEHRVPSENEISGALEKVGNEKINISDNSVKLADGTEIDLGSCAKGYAGDKAIEYLKSSEVEYAVLSLGGSIHTFGEKPNGVPFNITLADPKEPSKAFAAIEVGECAVVTSGVYQRYFEVNGIRYHHLLDARTGKCSNSDLLSVTVIVDYSDPQAGMKADFLSTAMFLIGSEACLEYQREVGGFDVIMVTSSGDVIVTDGIAESFELFEENGYKMTK